MECGEDMEYKREASACPATCLSPKAPDNCNYPKTEACVCPEGKMLEDGKCIDPENCGCINDNAVRYGVRESKIMIILWLTEIC